MNTEPRSRPYAEGPDLERAVRGLPLASVLLGTFQTAHAQPVTAAVSSDTATRSTLWVVLERLDGPTLVVALVGLLVLVLLVWRIWVTVRSESAAPPPRRAPRPTQTRIDDSLADRTTISRPTDWGADQDKRSAVGRARPSGMNADLPAIDHQATQWPPLDMQGMVGQGVLPPDALGRAPVTPPSPYRTGGFNPYYVVGRSERRFEADEIADAVTQAELLVQLGDPKEAMSLLARHIRETEKPGPSVWLMLLELYQSTGRQAQYNALADGFRTLFNADVPPWATSASSAARDLESYPQVIKRVRETWPGSECRTYLEGLLTDDRGGSRQGFTLTAYRELLLLVEILEGLAQLRQETRDQTEIERKLGTDR